MATLQHEPIGDRRVQLSIVPTATSVGSKADSYDVGLIWGEDVVFHRHIAGHQHEMGHYYLTRIAEAFLSVSELAHATLKVRNSLGEFYDDPLWLSASGEWFDIYLGWLELESGPVVEVLLYLSEVAEEQCAPRSILKQYVSTLLRCSVTSAERFGSALLEEIRAAGRAGEAGMSTGA